MRLPHCAIAWTGINGFAAVQLVMKLFGFYLWLGFFSGGAWAWMLSLRAFFA